MNPRATRNDAIRIALRVAWSVCATGVAAASMAAERKPLIVWGLGMGPDSKGLETVLRKFEELNPDLRLVVLKMGAGTMNPQKLMTAIVGNVPPDAVVQDRFAISDWASRGAFRPLDDLIERDRADPLCPRAEKYYPAAWDEATFEGKVYAIPIAADNRLLYFNRRVFRENADRLRAAGLDPEGPPRTWSEAIAYSKVLTVKDREGRLVRAGFIPNYGNAWLYIYAFQNNASFMSADGRTCTLASPETEEALRFMRDAYGVLGGYGEALKFESGFLAGESDPFITGRVAMKIDGDWSLNALSRYGPDVDFGTAFAPVPDDRFHRRGRFVEEKDTYITWSGGFAWAIPAGARNSEGGWRFIKFVTSTESRVLEARAQAAWERRRGRIFIPSIQGDIQANEIRFQEFKPALRTFAEALRMHIDAAKVGRIRPPTVVSQSLWDEHVRAIEAACTGKKAPAEALSDGQRVVQRELDDHFRKDSLPRFDFRVPILLIAGLASIGGAVVWFRRRSRPLGALARRDARWGLLMVSPWLLGFGVFTLGPMLASLVFSFTQYNVLSEPRWVGGANYASLATVDAANVLKAFQNVFYLAGIGVPLGIVTSLSVAVLLNTAARGIRVYRTIYYLPSIVPTVAGAVLWGWLLTPDVHKGLVNAAWNATVTPSFGLAPPGWLTAADWSKPALIMMGLWGAGGGIILWLAGLKGVPAQLHEAAAIDGATGSRAFWSITLPQLSPIIFFNVVIGFINAIQEFDRVYVMTSGAAGPSDSLLVPVLYLFTNGFHYFKMGYASALAWIVFLLILALTLVQFKLAPRWVHYEGDR